MESLEKKTYNFHQVKTTKLTNITDSGGNISNINFLYTKNTTCIKKYTSLFFCNSTFLTAALSNAIVDDKSQSKINIKPHKLWRMERKIVPLH